MKTTHCLGVAVVDAISGPLDRYPVPRVETQVTTGSVSFLPGGGAVNTASALGRMGLPAAVFAKIGQDLMGSFLIRQLEQCGVQTKGIRQSEHDTSPFTFVGVHPNGDRTFIHTPGANKTFTLADLDLKLLLDADFLLYQDFWAMPLMDAGAAPGLLASARQAGVTTFLDECWGLGPRKDLFEQVLPHCDYVLPSLDDLRAIYPGASPDAIVSTLLALGARAVALKMGPEGCLLAHGKERTLIPALPAHVVDSTGAGDCWNAGFIAGLAHGDAPETAACIANACAAFGIESIGGASGVPAYAEVLSRAKALITA